MSSYFESSETILDRMKSGITGVNTIEGSDIHNSQAPVSVELSNTKLQLDEVLKKVFAKSALDNGYDEWLEKRCSDFGIYRKAGNKANGYITFNGQAGATILANTIVQTQTGLRYFTSDSAVIPNGATNVKVKVVAENIGSAYNKIANTITYLPVRLINITSITNEEPFTNGYDIETNEDLFNRYITKIQTPASSGNKYHYKNWALECTGVGDCKVIPLWAGKGTVKVVIINSNKVGADATLIQTVKNYIDPNDGDGEGQAPIGATCTVVSADTKAINVNTTILLTENYTLDTVKTNIENELITYFKSVAFKQNYVSFAKIGSIILGTEGVADYNNLTINNGAVNVTLGDIEIPVIGSVVVTNA
ncbi:baseplate J/gp47 family protein [Clostridium beijerinckii]|uniref:Phage protein gp47/JayE n=1 Tax=Clostridium beijerinckii TaxID=1520 RepID=A0AAE5HAD1_CLOBE|nr:baseplate J/gp47 family protein [Clostridium beijerinckii]NSB17428.1 putative phage protein gp47/JayE [Clostridium beijerinckii]OOM28460.1 baseplate J-like protein [Clostridium beijerinckii]